MALQVQEREGGESVETTVRVSSGKREPPAFRHAGDSTRRQGDGRERRGLPFPQRPEDRSGQRLTAGIPLVAAASTRWRRWLVPWAPVVAAGAAAGVCVSGWCERDSERKDGAHQCAKPLCLRHLGTLLFSPAGFVPALAAQTAGLIRLDMLSLAHRLVNGRLTPLQSFSADEMPPETGRNGLGPVRSRGTGWHRRNRPA
jgi:hypothetical protein